LTWLVGSVCWCRAGLFFRGASFLAPFLWGSLRCFCWACSVWRGLLGDSRSLCSFGELVGSLGWVCVFRVGLFCFFCCVRFFFPVFSLCRLLSWLGGRFVRAFRLAWCLFSFLTSVLESFLAGVGWLWVVVASGLPSCSPARRRLAAHRPLPPAPFGALAASFPASFRSSCLTFAFSAVGALSPVPPFAALAFGLRALPWSPVALPRLFPRAPIVGCAIPAHSLPPQARGRRRVFLSGAFPCSLPLARFLLPCGPSPTPLPARPFARGPSCGSLPPASRFVALCTGRSMRLDRPACLSRGPPHACYARVRSPWVFPPGRGCRRWRVFRPGPTLASVGRPLRPPRRFAVWRRAFGVGRSFVSSVFLGGQSGASPPPVWAPPCATALRLRTALLAALPRFRCAWLVRPLWLRPRYGAPLLGRTTPSGRAASSWCCPHASEHLGRLFPSARLLYSPRGPALRLALVAPALPPAVWAAPRFLLAHGALSHPPPPFHPPWHWLTRASVAPTAPPFLAGFWCSGRLPGCFTCSRPLLPVVSSHPASVACFCSPLGCLLLLAAGSRACECPAFSPCPLRLRLSSPPRTSHCREHIVFRMRPARQPCTSPL